MPEKSSSPELCQLERGIAGLTFGCSWLHAELSQEEKDRMRSLNDYRVNLKAELEIRHLHEKMDHLINKQWQRLAEIQSLQLDKLAERRK